MFRTAVFYFIVIISLNSSQAFTQTDKNFLDLKIKFTDDAIIEKVKDGKPSQNGTLCQKGTLNGITYLIQSGSALFGVQPGADVNTPRKSPLWIVFCRIDDMTDARIADIKTLDSKSVLNVEISNDGTKIVWIGDVGMKLYPGWEIKLRIDKETPFVGQKGWTGSEAVSIIKELSCGKEILIHYREWPKDLVAVYRGSIKGFAETYQFALWSVNEQKPEFRPKEKRVDSVTSSTLGKNSTHLQSKGIGR